MLAAARVFSRKALECSKYSNFEVGGRKNFTQILKNVSTTYKEWNSSFLFA